MISCILSLVRHFDRSRLDSSALRAICIGCSCWFIVRLDYSYNFPQHLLCMSRCLYIPPFLEYFSCLVEEKGRTDCADIDLSVVFLFSDDSVLLMERSIFIRDERDAEIILVAELRMRGFRVLGHANYLDTELRKVWYESSEVLCLECASWSIILRVEVEESDRGR